MKKGHQEIMWLFLRFSLLVAIISISSNKGSVAAETVGNQDKSYIQKGDCLTLNERMSKLEVENRQQKQEMVVMKVTIEENRKEMKHLNGRISILEKSETAINLESDEIDLLSRPKRLYRLSPEKLRSEKDKEKSNADTERLHGPPTCCEDLQKVGYTLNGYYLIKRKKTLGANRIQVVYCQFDQQPEGNKKESIETWIGDVQVKMKSIHFYVQRSTKYLSNSGHGPITFDVEQYNVGGAMNLKTGEFTAPVDGIYHFEFRCLKDKIPEEVIIYLRKRAKDPNNIRLPSGFVTIDKEPIVAGTVMSNISYHSTGSLTASLKLKASDVVNLYSRSNRGFLYDSPGHYTQFAGWLVEEDLAMA